jgi:protein-S-isoprenylcysteine O-methyltransferase Ste14
MEAKVRRGVIGWALKGLFAKLFVALILFVSAGSLDWPMGWAYVAVFFAFDVATALALIPRHPGLLIERSTIQEGGKSWDSVILKLATGYLPMAAWAVAGLDERHGWSPQIAPRLQIAALVVVVLGYGLVVWAMAANAFFSVIVRIQEERGHTVASGGPYRYVRHPGYVGAILFTVAVPVMLGSWWALVPSVPSALLYVLRTALEDRTLQQELEGYAEYTQQTRYRLLPGVW